jgi:hypothetical protein
MTTALDVAELFAATFAARHDCHSPWIETPEGGQWICRREPLTGEVVLSAFRSGRPVAGYMLDVDSTTQLAAIDVDLEDGLMLADRVARVMTKAGCPAYIEPSRRGAHLWCSIGPFALPGIVVRRALRAFLQEAGIEPDPKIELRPGQDRLSGPDGVGTALRMPLMPHQTTRVKGVLMAPGGRIIAEKMHEALEAVETAPTATFAAWAERWAPPLDPRAIAPGDRPPRVFAPDDGVSATSILEDIGVVVRKVPGAVKCPFHPDTNPSLSIAADNRRVWCKSPACEAYGANGRGLGTNQLRKLIRDRAGHAA